MVASTRRKLAFALLPLALVVAAITAALGAMERLGVVDTHRDADVVEYLDGGTLVREGDTWRLYDPQLRQVVQAEVAVDKGDAFRVVVTGGSFVRGDHHVDPGSPPTGAGDLSSWTRAILRARMDRPVEVINAGASGQSSTRVRQLVEGLVSLEPDVLVVATGNNEGVVTWGTNEMLHQWVVYRGLKKVLLPEPPAEDRPPVTQQLAKRKPLEEQFERNLRQVVAVASRAHVPLVLCTLPANWTTAAAYAGAEAFDAKAREGDRLCRDDSYEAGMAAFAESTTSWGALQLSADCMRRRGEYEEARARYIAAIEFQPFGRTPESRNDAVRRIASGARVPLVDLSAAMQATDPHGLPGDQYFVDTAHLTVDGYHLMAETLVSALERADLLPGSLAATPTRPALEAAEGWTEALAQVRRLGF